jgi:hypothetical protein
MEHALPLQILKPGRKRSPKRATRTRKKEITMKRILLATAIAAVAATPVLAQATRQPTPAPNYPYQNSWTNTYGAEPRWQHGAVARPYAYAPGAMAYAPGAMVASGPMAVAPAPMSDAAGNPFAWANATTGTVVPPLGSPYAVESINGRYIGADPDPRIRQSLIRDQQVLLGSGPGGR